MRTQEGMATATLVAWVTAFAVVAASVAHGQLTARVGEAFYLPLAFERDQSARVTSAQASVRVEPDGILRPEYASGPRRCCANLGNRGVAMMCDGMRSIRGPLVQIVYTAVAPGTATITLTGCRIGEAWVDCPPPVTLEVRR